MFAEDAGPDDAPALAALETLCAGGWGARAFERELRGGTSRVLVLRRPGLAPGASTEIVAYCAFRTMADEVEVLGLAVAPGSRRRGLARWLLRLALGLARRRGARTAFLEVRPSNGAAIALYGALGFGEAGRRPRYYQQPAEDALVLMCRLS